MKAKIRMNENLVVATSLLKRCANDNHQVAMSAQVQLGEIVQSQIREGIMSGDIVDGIFTPKDFSDGRPIEYPLDLLAPGTEKDYVAYTMPNHGYVPEKTVEGDYVVIPTYRVASSIDWLLEHAKHADWDMVSRALEVLQGTFVKKINNDGWHTILTAAVDRNIVAFDSDAAVGQFTKRLVSLMRTVMKRNGGGNSTSLNLRKLTDLYLSVEGMEDMVNWNIDQATDELRNEFMAAPDGKIKRFLGINFHDLFELGEGHEFQTYFTSTLGASLAASDVELVVGLDLSNQLSFVMPVREPISIFPDENLHRAGRQGYYGWTRLGFGALDNRCAILGSF